MLNKRKPAYSLFSHYLIAFRANLIQKSYYCKINTILTPIILTQKIFYEIETFFPANVMIAFSRDHAEIRLLRNYCEIEFVMFKWRTELESL